MSEYKVLNKNTIEKIYDDISDVINELNCIGGYKDINLSNEVKSSLMMLQRQTELFRYVYSKYVEGNIITMGLIDK